jgi:hypothetical protein
MVSQREFPVRARAHDAAGRVSQMRLRIGDEPWGEAVPYAQDFPVRLPAGSGVFPLSIRVADDAGNWSEPGVIRVRGALAPPKLVEGPTLRANSNGVVISFLTDAECHAAGEYGANRNYGMPLLLSGTANSGEKGAAAREHVLGALFPGHDPNQLWYFRIRLADHKGKTTHEFTGEFHLAGQPQTYQVDPAGVDEETGGTPERPWRTLQYAVDRTLPGDQVTVMSGVYPEGALITRGGVAGAPLIIRAGDKWKSVIDGQNRVSKALLQVKNAAYVEIAGFELRWFGDRSHCAVSLENAPHVTVRECKIWNELRWGEGRVGGIGVVADKSPDFVLERSLLCRLDIGLRLSDSPRAPKTAVCPTLSPPPLKTGRLSPAGKSIPSGLIRANATCWNLTLACCRTARISAPAKTARISAPCRSAERKRKRNLNEEADMAAQ